MDRVYFKWTHRYNPRYEKTAVINAWDLKEANPWNLTYYKGELHGLFSRRMAEYIIESDVALGYLDWCWNTGHPTEHYWNTLNYNPHLKAPGGYEGRVALTVSLHHNTIPGDVVPIIMSTRGLNLIVSWYQ